MTMTATGGRVEFQRAIRTKNFQEVNGADRPFVPGPAGRPQVLRTMKARALRRSLHQSTSPTVARITSSGVVNPANTFRLPSSRRERIPISSACARNTEEGTLS